MCDMMIVTVENGLDYLFKYHFGISLTKFITIYQLLEQFSTSTVAEWLRILLLNYGNLRIVLEYFKNFYNIWMI